GTCILDIEFELNYDRLPAISTRTSGQVLAGRAVLLGLSSVPVSGWLIRSGWFCLISKRSGSMWVRKCYVDDQSDIQSPIPSCISSNEEFYPPAQSAQEREVENRLREVADKNAKKLGLSRRGFL